MACYEYLGGVADSLTNLLTLAIEGPQAASRSSIAAAQAEAARRELAARSEAITGEIVRMSAEEQQRQRRRMMTVGAVGIALAVGVIILNR